MKRKYLIAGNWKMNTTHSTAETLVSEIVDGISKIDNLQTKVLVCPPFINISGVFDIARNSLVKVGSQNCYFEEKGAFTGEISIPMLKEVGCSYIIIGHSERRAIFNESNFLINKKVKAILDAELNPILCIGETLEERQTGKTFDVLQRQLNECLQDLSIDEIARVVIAYEPVWAIGTGVSATPKEIAEAHLWMRNYFIEKVGDFTAKDIYLLYGGSLNDANAKETLSIANVDGGLIGGASLVASKFLSIIETAEHILHTDNNEYCCCCE